MQIHADLVDATVARLVAANVLGGKIAKDRDVPTDVSEMPLAIVHVMADKARPAGGARTGIPDFVHETALCIDAYAHGEAGAAVKRTLYQAGEAALQALLADPTWLALIEGVQSIESSYLLPQEGMHVFAGLRIELVVLHRTEWPPALAEAPDFATASIGVDMDGDGDADLGATVSVPTA